MEIPVPLNITSTENLTDAFILEISDELFARTMAYTAFKSKQLFINKINDLNVRYSMIKNIVQISNV